MGRLARAALGLALAMSVAAPKDGLAQDQAALGTGRITVNDSLGDFHDRWRTGSYTVSKLGGPPWTGTLPTTPGSLLEYRLRGEVVAPTNLTTPSRGDRRYAGLLSIGLHSHFQTRSVETSLGLDVVVTGPQTGLDNVQAAIHRVLDYPAPAAAVMQIPDNAYPTLVAEFGRSLDLGKKTRLRPFVEAQAGIETFARVGFDLVVGSYGRGALMLREQVTGQRYRAVDGKRDPGLSLTLGGDIARVFYSALLPEDGVAQLSPTRTRLRAGLAWQGRKSQLFYGLTWLGKEFEGQREGQLVGALSLQLNY